MFGGFHSVGCEFSVCELTIWYIQKKEEEIHQLVDEATLNAVKSIVCVEALGELENG